MLTFSEWLLKPLCCVAIGYLLYIYYYVEINLTCSCLLSLFFLFLTISIIITVTIHVSSSSTHTPIVMYAVDAVVFEGSSEVHVAVCISKEEYSQRIRNCVGVHVLY